MSKGYRQKSSNQDYLYSESQIRRTLIASGIDIVSEVDIDFIIFCPFHSNSRTPAGEVHKENGLFYCFSCQETKTLIEVVMKASGRTYFEALRLIDSKSDNKNLLESIEQTLEKKVEFKEYDLQVIDKLHRNVFRNKRAQEYFTSRKYN
jgi:DNA primase